MKIVKITWRDSNQELYQREITDLLKVELIKSVGIILEESEERVVICRDLMNEDKDCRGMIAIPRENILKIEQLLYSTK